MQTAKKVVMPECLKKRGYLNKYIIECDDSTDVLIYFSDENGNIDNNNGKYYSAKSGVNYFVTPNAREPLTLNLTNSFNGIADMARVCEFKVDVKGGYAPYTYKMTFENLDTGAVTTYDRCENFIIERPFHDIGNYIATLKVIDFANNEVTATNDFVIKDLPFEFSELTVTPNNKIMTGDELEFCAVTQNESIISHGLIKGFYDFVIKNTDTNEVVYQTSKNADDINSKIRTSIINLSWTPVKAGNYSITVSSTDGKKQYAEKTIEFTVTEYNGTLLGDVNNNGEITVIDAILIMRYSIDSDTLSNIWTALSDCNKDDEINLKDVICILRYCVSDGNSAYVGEVNYKELPTEPPTEKQTEKPTEKPTENPTENPTEKPTEAPTVPVEENIVTFSNSLGWDGTIYCYYWSDSDTGMTTWPGKQMVYYRTNSMGQKQYTFEVPKNVDYIIFTNGSKQTVNIKYSGGIMKYYAKDTTDSKGRYNVDTWD